MIRVRGAVARPGDYDLTGPATVPAALEAAGGWAQLPRRWASGRFTVRRRRAPGEVQAWDFAIQEPAAWQDFALVANDLLVVQWHLQIDSEIGTPPAAEPGV